MVFARAVKTAIKKKLTNLFFVSAIILAATAFNFNAVFARSGMDISVEVNWTDQSVSTRPASVTLRLKRDSCSGTEAANTTLTSADVNPSDNNKWVGVFVNVPRYVNYYVFQDNVTGYNTETDHAVDIGVKCVVGYVTILPAPADGYLFDSVSEDQILPALDVAVVEIVVPLPKKLLRAT